MYRNVRQGSKTTVIVVSGTGIGCLYYSRCCFSVVKRYFIDLLTIGRIHYCLESQIVLLNEAYSKRAGRTVSIGIILFALFYE